MLRKLSANSDDHCSVAEMMNDELLGYIWIAKNVIITYCKILQTFPLQYPYNSRDKCFCMHVVIWRVCRGYIGTYDICCLLYNAPSLTVTCSKVYSSLSRDFQTHTEASHMWPLHIAKSRWHQSLQWIQPVQIQGNKCYSSLLVLYTCGICWSICTCAQHKCTCEHTILSTYCSSV